MTNFLDWQQLGFAGFSGVLLWMLYRVIAFIREDRKVVETKFENLLEKNTEAFVNHKNSINNLNKLVDKNTKVTGETYFLLKSINGKMRKK